MSAAGWGAAASAAASVHQAFINAKAQTDASKFQVQFASDTNVINRAIEKDRFENRLQYATKDAQAAGLHSLFALGTAGGGGFSGGTTIGPTPTGSYAGTGISRAGESIERAIKEFSGKKGAAETTATRAQMEIHALNVRGAQGKIQLDDLEAMKRSSELKLAEQQLLYWGNNFGGGITSTGGPESMTTPLGVKSGIPLNKSPITNISRRSIPGWIEMKNPKGRRMVRNPKVFGDEIQQIDTATRPWLDYSESYRRKFAPSMKNPTAYYYYWKNYFKNQYKRRKR